jgi:hypothetical protein
MLLDSLFPSGTRWETREIVFYHKMTVSSRAVNYTVTDGAFFCLITLIMSKKLW